MLIILEGPDGGGKSTLMDKARSSSSGDGSRRRFVSQLGGRTIGQDAMRTNTYGLFNQLRNGHFDEATVLCERLHAVSDLVYRGVFGGDPFLSKMEMDVLFHGLGRRHDVRVVYCRPPVQEVINRGLEKAGDDTEEWLEEVAHKLRPLYEAYDKAMARLSWQYGLPVVHYDFTSPSGAELEAAICAA